MILISLVFTLQFTCFYLSCLSITNYQAGVPSTPGFGFARDGWKLPTYPICLNSSASFSSATSAYFWVESLTLFFLWPVAYPPDSPLFAWIRGD